MPIPLYGFLEGDTLGLLMLAEEGETVLELARKLQDAASIRVARNDKVDLVYQRQSNRSWAHCRTGRVAGIGSL